MTRFAVELSPGASYLVGDLRAPTRTRETPFPPEGAVALDAETFERAKGSPDALRRAVIGDPNPVRKAFEAVHLMPSALFAASQALDRLGAAIETWKAEGRPDPMRRNEIMPDAQAKVRDLTLKLGIALDRRPVKAAYLAANPSTRAPIQKKLGAICDDLRSLTGMTSIGGGLNDLGTGIEKLNSFLVDTGAAQPLIESAEEIGEATMIFGLKNSVYRHQID